MEPDRSAWEYIVGALLTLFLALVGLIRYIIVKQRNGQALKTRDQRFCTVLEKDIVRLDEAINKLSGDVKEAREHLAEIEGRLSK